MRKWDYYIQAFESDDVNYMEDELTDRGNEGWEAVCVLRCGRLLMKREKKNSMVPVDKEPEPGIPQFQQ
jgi:hypothetical protein